MPLLWPSHPAGASWMQALKVQMVTWLRADPVLDDLVAGRVYTVVPPHAAFPLITVETPAAVARNTFRHPKRLVSIQVRAQSQDLDEAEMDTIADQLTAVLEGAAIAPIGPYRAARWDVDPTQSPAAYSDDLAGVVTRHRPTIFRITFTP